MKKISKLNALMGGSAMIALFVTASPVKAQMAVPEGAAAVQDEPTGGIQEIVVTSRKRAERLQDIPVAVTAISSQQLERLDLSTLEKVASTTPNFSITRASNGSGAQLSLRGIGSSFTSIGIEQSVATVVDGVYYGQGRIINEGLFDLDRIEILKGPQSLFFGKNSTAGVVSITTADPTSKPEFIARVGYEFKANETYGEFIGSGPLNDTLGIRVALRGSRMTNGYVSNQSGPITYSAFDVATGATNTYTAAAGNDGPQNRSFLGRVTLKWEPTSDFTATVKASINRDNAGNPAWNYVNYTCGSEGIAIPGSPCGKKFANSMNRIPAEIAATMPFATDDGKLRNRYRSNTVTATLNYDAGPVMLTSVTNYNDNRNLFNLDADYVSSEASNVWANEVDAFKAFSTEQRALTQFGGMFELMGGVYYQHTKLRARQFTILGGVEDSTADPSLSHLGFTKDSGTTDETLAAYGQAILKLGPQVELTGGVRYTHETKDSYFVQPYVNAALQGVFLEDQRFGTNQTFNNWSPEVTATWKPTPDLTAYLAYKTGYKSGGFSNTAIQSAFGSQSDFAFAPEKVRGVEGGIKGMLAGRQIRYSLGAYYYKFSDLQVDFFNSTTVSFVTTNAGSAKVKGVEFEVEYAPGAVPGLDFRLSANYNSARYANYLAPCFAGQSIAEGCAMTVNGVPYQSLDGKPTANAPQWTGALTTSYETAIGGGLAAAFSMGARYSDSYLASPFNNTLARQGSYVSLDGSIRLKTEDDRYELALIGKNLTNHFIINGTLDVVGTGSGTGTSNAVRADQAGLIGLPRTVQLQATMRF
ncbi:TonB-dependent receptor [Novosphingobium resinovorum]|uniref:TonB-dependent receptor n=1 Tax=Novosphingobium TaxID=165696 RepID=UPI001B3C56E4|nr:MULTISPECIES: TonB-dependent receptor [Novosphingobium]MBF7013668.1 TonB-dependent receptor [Novosphingobium sp. HR1a]WJM25816.1 TonB-dependent receptor [Novosphingobium resinovorum]